MDYLWIKFIIPTQKIIPYMMFSKNDTKKTYYNGEIF